MACLSFYLWFSNDGFPRWMGYKPIDKDKYIAPFIWLNAGLFIFEISLFFSASSALSGIGVFLFGWVYGIFVLYQTFKNAPAQNKLYEKILLGTLISGSLGASCFAWWIYSDDWQFIQLSFSIGIWLYLIPTLFSVSHRMLPFFSSNIISNYKIYQPSITLLVFVSGCIAHFILETMNLQEWLFVADAPLAGIALLHSIRWRIQHSFKDRLLAVLHMAFLWLFIGLALFSIQSLLLLFSGEFILNKAPLHAITIGFFVSLLVAMASRVTMGHSGRQLILDSTSWYLFIGLQLTAIARIFADLQFDNVLQSHNFNLLAVALWLISLSVWFIKYAPIYLTARVDGREG